MKRLLKAARLSATQPRVGFLALRMAAWRMALPVMRRFLPLARVLRLITAPPRRRERSPEREALVIDLAQRVFGGPAIADRSCFDRSLVAYRFLSRLNAEPRLVIGLRKRDGATTGHAWVLVDDSPVHDSPELLEPFEIVTTLPSASTSAPEPRPRP